MFLRNEKGVMTFLFIVIAGIAIWGTMNAFLKQSDLTKRERKLKANNFTEATTSSVVNRIIENSNVCDNNFIYRKAGDDLLELMIGDASNESNRIALGEPFPGTQVRLMGARILPEVAQFNNANGSAMITLRVKVIDPQASGQGQFGHAESILDFEFPVQLCDIMEVMLVDHENSWNDISAQTHLEQHCQEHHSGDENWNVAMESVAEVAEGIWIGKCRNSIQCNSNAKIQSCI